MEEALRLTKDLIAAASVTPMVDAACLQIIERFLGSDWQFTRVTTDDPDDEGAQVQNLLATRALPGGDDGPHILLAGHVDVVPPGPLDDWQSKPFEMVERDGRYYGRGTADMKAGMACLCAAAREYVDAAAHQNAKGRISIIAAGDEEGLSRGTKALLDEMAVQSLKPDVALVGESTSQHAFGDMVKVGRRGNAYVTVIAEGKQGHSARPEVADNALHKLTQALNHLINQPLDAGTDLFPPSTLQVTRLECDNTRGNVIPGDARAWVNVRYNPNFNFVTLCQWFRDMLSDFDGITLEFEDSGDAYVVEDNPLVGIVQQVIKEVAGIQPKPDTGGGASDGRFIKDVCPVLEFGLVGTTMHQANESIAMDEFPQMLAVYKGVLERFFQ